MFAHYLVGRAEEWSLAIFKHPSEGNSASGMIEREREDNWETFHSILWRKRVNYQWNKVPHAVWLDLVEPVLEGRGADGKTLAFLVLFLGKCHVNVYIDFI